MTSLPPLAEILSSPGTADSALARALSILFEPSPVLLNKLVPEISTSTLSLDSYSSLTDVVISTISSWDPHSKAAFIAGHPRIGEVTNLSHLSQQEQAAKATPPDVLLRLAQLNAAYEQRYPGLRYITFVNGRSRAAIKEEMETRLELSHDSDSGTEAVDPGNARALADEEIDPVKVGGREWLAELDRAIGDVGKIAKSRLGALGVV